MPNPRHLAILQQGLARWNRWREEDPGPDPDPEDVLDPEYLEESAKGNPYLTRADLSAAQLEGQMLRGVNFQEALLERADLQGCDLVRANLFNADLRGANLREAQAWDADFRGADLNGADLRGAFFRGASFVGADLREADLREADVSYCNFRGADFTGAKLNAADLSISTLVNTRLAKCDLTDCRVYGVSAWDVGLEGAVQSNLIITPADDAEISVDNLEVAQFLYLIVNNEKLRGVIDTITSKVVLILGRFTPERKAVLDAIRTRLRDYNYVPVLFDFEKPASRDTHETITTLARMARFVIADITEARSIPQELVSIVQQLPSLPVQPIIAEGYEPWGMYDHIRRYPWVLELRTYDTLEALGSNLDQWVIEPAERQLKGEAVEGSRPALRSSQPARGSRTRKGRGAKGQAT